MGADEQPDRADKGVILMPRIAGINCSKCGRFVGKGGFIDVSPDEYNGSALELGYSLCKRCLDEQQTLYDLGMQTKIKVDEGL